MAFSIEGLAGKISPGTVRSGRFRRVLSLFSSGQI